MGLVIEKERKKRQEDCGVFQTSTWASECPATTFYYVHNIFSLKIKKKLKGWKQKVYQKPSNRSNQSPRFQNLEYRLGKAVLWPLQTFTHKKTNLSKEVVNHIN